MKTSNPHPEVYNYAKKQVQKLKGFYTHLVVYIAINSMIVFGTFYDRPFNNETFLSFETFATAVFWGMGLLVHAASVFVPNLIFNKEWEQKKIKDFMNEPQKPNWE